MGGINPEFCCDFLICEGKTEPEKPVLLRISGTSIKILVFFTPMSIFSINTKKIAHRRDGCNFLTLKYEISHKRLAFF
jgi:hypothetical protein